ncbi:ACT domain-containing protein [Polaribacter gochangensis]|uniref:ACT domain-containing protein n=1 Tax=Polaribacter gochangensis TaxID=3252903 RepID=UPI0039047163
MSGEKNLRILIKKMKPIQNSGDFVFVTVSNVDAIPRSATIFEFKEKEGITLVLEKTKAEELGLSYQYVASWITLKVHSALDAVGLTAAFSNELAKYNISSNVIAGFYHDHIFVDKKDGEKTVKVLTAFSENY